MDDNTKFSLDARKDSWSRYWASGALHSCADSFEGGMGAGATAFWNRVFRMIGSGDRVLELGAGNGALVQHLYRRYLQGARIRVDAIDLSQIQPPWRNEIRPELRDTIRFHPGTRMEELPFPDQSMSYVVGQYAIEYADWDAAWAEVFRVCRKTSRIGMLLHHRDAVPVAASTEEAGHCDWLLGEDSIYDLAERLIPYMAMASTEIGRQRLADDAQAAELKQAYNTRQAELAARGQASKFPDLLMMAAQGCNEVFSRAAQYGRESARELLAAQRMHVGDAKLRLVEARECALDGAAMSQLAASLHAQGFNDVEYRALEEQGQLFAWSLYAHRP